MKFTAPYAATLEGGGHVLVFAKGETKFVPPALRQAAVAKGFEPEEGAEITSVSAPDDSGRKDAVKAAMKLIAERNNADDFDASGTPKVRAIEAVAGGVKPVDNKERLALWAEVAASVGT